MTLKEQGKGYFRKSKAYGLVCGIALAGALIFSAGNVSADEVTTPTDSQPSTKQADVQPASSEANNSYADQANTSTAAQEVAVDNSSVKTAVDDAKQAGVGVTQDATQDKGTPTNTADLNQAKAKIAQDQAQQVDAIKRAQATQEANNTAYNGAQTAIKANNDYVSQQVHDHGSETTVTVSNNNSTATDGTAQANQQAKKIAQEQLSENKRNTDNYVAAFKRYQDTVARANEVNQALDGAITDLKNKSVTVTVKDQVVNTVEEVEALNARNQAAIQAANDKVEVNRAVLRAYEELQNTSNQVNQDADSKGKELSGIGATVNYSTQTVKTTQEAQVIAQQNQAAYSQAKDKQAQWQAQYQDLQSKTGTEGYTKEVVLQALDFDRPNPQARVNSSAAGAQVTSTGYIGTTSGTSGYARILDSTGVLKYSNVGAGWSTSLDYHDLQGITATTADGQVRNITRIHREFRIIQNGATGLVNVYVLNDPTEGFVVSRNNGLDDNKDYMNFSVTDTYYYNVNGQEVAFTASEKAPIAITYSSLNNNPIGREGAKAVNGRMVEINGSTVTVHDDGYAYASNYNRPQDVGVDWDTSSSPSQYKGATIGYFTSGSAFNTEFIQWDGPEDSRGQTYWFATNTRVVSPVSQPGISANLTKTNVDPVTVDPVSAELVKATNPEKPTLSLTTVSETQNQIIKASYHDYKLQYKPTVLKTQTNSDGANTNSLTVAKGDLQEHKLSYENVLANIKVGDTVTITDPLDGGVGSDSGRALEEAKAKGWTTANFDEASNTYTFSYVYQGKFIEAPVLYVKPEYDKGLYKNTYNVKTGDYSVYSNTVTYKTPDKPKPTKTVTDNSGADIDGATIFDKHVNYGLTTDYSPYSSLTASKEAIAKGFGILDDVQDGAFTVDVDHITIKDRQNKDVKALFDMYHVLSDKGRTEAVSNFLKQAGLEPKGEFYLWVAKDPVTFYSDYVSKNRNITINLPATLTVNDGEKVENDFQQIDFGNPYVSNLVVNDIPTVQPEKHALDAKDETKVLDGQEVKIGDYIHYLLDGVTVGKRHETLWQYDGLDKLDTAHDRYTGNWKGVIKGTEYTAKEDMTLPYDVTTKDGQVIKAGDKISKDTEYHFTFTFDQDTNSDFINKIIKVTWDAEKGEWAYTIDKEFLNSLGVEGTFDADFYIEVERIAAGEVENTFINTVNGKEMVAKVTTHTPENPIPETPTQVPQQPQLPHTGEMASVGLAGLGAMLLGLGGLLGSVRRNKPEDID